jgi:hypothetical protein
MDENDNSTIIKYELQIFVVVIQEFSFYTNQFIIEIFLNVNPMSVLIPNVNKI